MNYIAGDYDIAVIGAGHAGCEAALSSARMGMKTIVFSISLEAVANMPCNPHIGGSSKGHLVREIDALGGEMGKNIDKTMTQIKMLNTSKGPAVHSLRAQADRKKYQMEMKHTLEKQSNLEIKQAEIIDIKVENKKVVAVETDIGAIYNVKSVIIATGTYLKGKIFIGEFSKESGPDGVFPSNKLSECLKKLGVELIRFKTGTPARINRKSIDFSKMEVQKGDDGIVPFSFEDEIKEQFDTNLDNLISFDKNSFEIIVNNKDAFSLPLNVLIIGNDKYFSEKSIHIKRSCELTCNILFWYKSVNELKCIIIADYYDDHIFFHAQILEVYDRILMLNKIRIRIKNCKTRPFFVGTDIRDRIRRFRHKKVIVDQALFYCIYHESRVISYQKNFFIKH